MHTALPVSIPRRPKPPSVISDHRARSNPWALPIAVPKPQKEKQKKKSQQTATVPVPFSESRAFFHHSDAPRRPAQVCAPGLRARRLRGCFRIQRQRSEISKGHKLPRGFRGGLGSGPRLLIVSGVDNSVDHFILRPIATATVCCPGSLMRVAAITIRVVFLPRLRMCVWSQSCSGTNSSRDQVWGPERQVMNLSGTLQTQVHSLTAYRVSQTRCLSTGPGVSPGIWGAGAMVPKTREKRKMLDLEWCNSR